MDFICGLLDSFPLYSYWSFLNQKKFQVPGEASHVQHAQKVSRDVSGEICDAFDSIKPIRSLSSVSACLNLGDIGRKDTRLRS